METTKIKVISCVKMREKEGKPIYAVGLSDGQGGESFNQAIPIDTPIDQLELTPTQWGLRIKMKNAGGSFGGGGFKRGNYNEAEKFPGFALAYSKDLVVAGKVELKQLLHMATFMHSWLVKKHKETAAVAPAPGSAAPAPPAAAAPPGPAFTPPTSIPDLEPAGAGNGTTDDLPF